MKKKSFNLFGSGKEDDSNKELQKVLLVEKVTIGMFQRVHDFLKQHSKSGYSPESIAAIPKNVILDLLADDVATVKQYKIANEVSDVLKKAIEYYFKNKGLSQEAVQAEFSIWRTVFEVISKNPKEDISEIEKRLLDAQNNPPKTEQKSSNVAKETPKKSKTVIINDFLRFYQDLCMAVNSGNIDSEKAEQNLKEYVKKLRKEGMDYEAMTRLVEEIEKHLQKEGIGLEESNAIFEKLETAFDLPILPSWNVEDVIPKPQEKVKTTQADSERVTNQALDALIPFKKRLEDAAQKLHTNPGAKVEFDKAQSEYNVQLEKARKTISDFQAFTVVVDKNGKPIRQISASALNTIKRVGEAGLN